MERTVNLRKLIMQWLKLRFGKRTGEEGILSDVVHELFTRPGLKSVFL